jgi:hypothetical protein
VTLKNLKALAARRHNGNVSALLAEVAAREAKIERIEAEWHGAAPTKQKKKRRRAA